MSATVTAGAPPGVPSQAQVMAHAPSENFPVAAYVLGRRRRRHLLAIYGFARLVDELGDEAPGDRSALLHWLDSELGAVFDGRSPGHPAMRELMATVRECRLPEEPFHRLLEANRLDQVKLRYETFAELLDYCQLSAAPVGELVLHLFGAPTRDRIELSDRICAALQLTEHLQDLAEDQTRERIYLPLADMRRFGCSEDDLAAPAASPELKALIAFEVQRARSLLDAGASLCTRLSPGGARLAVAAFVGGGRAALTGIEMAGYDVLSTRPARPRTSFMVGLLKAVVGR